MLRTRITKLLCALLIAFPMAVLHWLSEERLVSEMFRAVKKQGVPLITLGATPVGLHHQQARGVTPPFLRPEMY